MITSWAIYLLFHIHLVLLLQKMKRLCQVKEEFIWISLFRNRMGMSVNKFSEDENWEVKVSSSFHVKTDWKEVINPLSANPTKLSNALK